VARAAEPVAEDQTAPDPFGDAVNDGLARASVDLKRCWEKAAADGWKVKGTIKLGLTFAKDGKVKKVAVVSDDTGDALLQTCVVELARKWNWGPEAGKVGKVEVPIGFAMPAAQYTVRLEDVPVIKPKGGKLEARVLLDADNVGADKASLVQLNLMGATQIPTHSHSGIEILYVLEGNVRVDAISGKQVELGAGDVAYLSAGIPHGLYATCCKRKFSKYLILYAPGGIERGYKDAAAARKEGTTTAWSKEDIKAKKADQSDPKVVKAADVKALAVAGGKGKVKILGDKDSVGDTGAYVGHLTLAGRASIDEHVHKDEAEILFILKGRGILVIDGLGHEVVAGMGVYIPAGAKHAFTATTDEDVEAVQFYAPGGPEQRFKQAETAGAEKKKPKK
jgi:quercetin dioxygenase-like cupin family protein